MIHSQAHARTLRSDSQLVLLWCYGDVALLPMTLRGRQTPGECKHMLKVCVIAQKSVHALCDLKLDQVTAFKAFDWL